MFLVYLRKQEKLGCRTVDLPIKINNTLRSDKGDYIDKEDDKHL